MSWAPSFIIDNGWARRGDLALRELPVETCLFSQAWALSGRLSLGAGQTLWGRVTSACKDPLLSARPGPPRVKVVLRDLAQTYQNRE